MNEGLGELRVSQTLFCVPGNLVPITKKRSVGMHDIQFAHRNDLWYNKDCRAKRMPVSQGNL